MNACRLKRRLSSIASIGWILMLAACCAGAAEPRRVLLLHSFGREFEPFSTFSENFRLELARQSAEPLDFFDVALQSARFGEEAREGPFVDYLLALFAGRRLDLVVPIGGPAVRFAQKHRDRVFPQVPALIAAVDQRHLSHASLTLRDAVVAVRHDPTSIVEDLLRRLPATTNILVVFGDSPLERFWVDELHREFEPFTSRVGFEWVNTLSFDQILARAGALPPRSAIFYGQMTVDANGVPHAEGRALDELHAVANAPIFGVHDYQLGRGIVGGPLSSVSELSRQSATAAGRILRGESPDQIRPPPMGPGKPVYDWRELQRWAIREASLPPGSEVRFRELNLWQRHPQEIALVLSALLAQGVVISLLLANRSRLRSAEQSLREGGESLRAILDTTAEGIITINDRGIIESVNVAAEKIFGYTAGELIGQDVGLLTASPFCAEHDPHFASPANTGHPLLRGLGREVSGRRKDGSVFPMDLAVSEIMLANRRAFTAFVRDITERRQAERAARDLSGRLIAAQEAERARLARELHDDITQRLARLAIDAGRLESGAAKDSSEETIRDVREGLVRLSEDVHSLSYRLHPSLLEELGLGEALKAECERFARREGIPCEVKLRELTEPIPRDLALGLFRIAQEALRNTARHAQASAVEVTLRPLDDGLQLAVRDDGAGFDPTRKRERVSLGLAGMAERVHLLGGDLDIESAPGHGTTVVAWVPLNRHEA